jgi:hypothetical protein
MMPGSVFLARCSAFGCGAVVALVLIAARQPVNAASAARTIHTCAAADGSLRLSDPATPCQPDERRVRVQIPGQDDQECKSDDARLEKLKQHLNDLETRDRKGTLRGRRVKAPFQVVTRKGLRVLRIEEHNVTFYNLAGKPVVWIVADNSGGMLQTQSINGDREATISAQGNLARILIKEHDKDRIDLGRRKNGRYGLQVFGASDKMVSYLGQSEVGSGLLVISDANGVEKAAMYVRKQDGAGRVHVMNPAGAVVGVMQASGSEGESPFQLSNASGAAMVEAGLIATGAGVVRAGPEFRNFGVGMLGLVPSMVMGKP